MFVSEERLLAVTFAEASVRLSRAGHGGWLSGRSQAVYDGGVEYLHRVGPLGAVPGASKLVRVRLGEPVHRDGAVSIALRWEAVGGSGGLFPALDADIRLSDDDENGTRVTLTGSYRPPLGPFGEKLDRLLLRAVAVGTIRALLSTIADELEGSPARAREAAVPWWPEPGPEPAPG
jgi:hypothetical protein